MARGVDEGDLTLFLVDLGRHLVGADGLGDATRLPGDHVGLADRVEQLGLAVVDVTHDGDHRRTGCEILFAALVLAELDVEALQQLAVLVLGRDDLDLVVELAGEHLQRVLGHGLGGRHHLAQVEQHLDQRRHVDVDLLGQVGQRGATGEPDGLPVALADAYATDLRCLHLVELLTTLTLGLASPTHRTAGATERALGAAATATTAATGGRTAGAATGTTRPGRHRDHGRRARPATGAGRGPPAGPPSWPELCLGIIAGLGRGMPGTPPDGRRARPPAAGGPASGGRGPPGRLGSTGGRGGGTVPMPWDGANGLLPGRGVPGRRGARVARQTAGAARTRPRTGLSRVSPGPGWPGVSGRAAGLVRPSSRRVATAGRPRAPGACWPGAAGTAPGRGAPGAGRCAAGLPVCSPTGVGRPDGGRLTLPAGASGGGPALASSRAGLLVGGAARAATLGRRPGARPRSGRGAAGGRRRRRGAPAAFLAGLLAGGGPLASFSLRRRTTGASRVEEADRTNSPMSFACEDGLAFDSELFRKLVDSDLCHCSPCAVRALTPDQLVVVHAH